MTWWLCSSRLAFTLIVTSVATSSPHSGIGRKFKDVENVIEEIYGSRGTNKFPDANLVSSAVSDICSPCPWQPRGGGEDIKNCTIVRGSAFCNDSGFTSVPKNLPKNITRLDLDKNFITDLPDGVFQNYSKVRHLILSRNRLARLNNCSFYNLGKLESLYLFLNKLVMPGSYPDHVFCPVRSLYRLYLEENNINDSVSYPDKALSCLSNLRVLAIDGLPVNKSGPFGEGFQNLTRLTNLTLSRQAFSYCTLGALNNDTFQNLQNLIHLDVSSCSLVGMNIQAGAFEPLRKLRSLDISYNMDIYWENLNNVFWGLQKANSLTYLKMDVITQRYSLSICLDYSLVSHFPQTITHLLARRNNLEFLDPLIVSQLGSNLISLDLSGNPLSLGSYFLNLADMKELQTLTLQGYYDLNIPRYFPKNYQSQKHDCSNCKNTLSYSENLHFILPPKLKILDMMTFGMGYELTNINFGTNNTLEKLIWKENYFPRLEGTIYGLNWLQYLDLSACSIKSMSIRVFQELTSLQILRLDCNNLADYFARPESVDVFSDLINLTSLNLSSNYIYDLPKDIFVSLTQLGKLYLKNNRLSSFTANISVMNKLTFLDLSDNNVMTFPQYVQAHIDMLLQKGIHVQVKLENTHVLCDCDNLQFLHWMIRSKAFTINLNSFRCYQKPNNSFTDILTAMTGYCISHTLILSIVACSTIALFFSVIGIIIYRYRWNIRYLYFAAYNRYQKNDRGQKDMAFENDAFVCYAQKDYEFAEHVLDRELNNRGLKVFLHGRDFKAGEYVTSNIVRAVCSSKTTLVLLTQALMDSYWCNYEIEMAKLEGVYTGRQVLIFIIMEDIPKGKLGKDLAYSIKNNTYMEYPQSVANLNQLKIWWDKLASDIQG